jgi:hypothetical protein
MKIIRTRAELRELARELGVRPDWHEPDEQSLTARVHGTSFDNAMGIGDWYGAGRDGVPQAELHVILYRVPSWSDFGGTEPEPLAVVNLATLFAWAADVERDDARNLALAREDWADLRAVLFDALKVNTAHLPLPSVPEMVQRLIRGYDPQREAASPEPPY